MKNILLTAALALSLGACATTNNKSNYESYLQTIQNIESNKTVAAEAGRIAKQNQYASLRESCTTDACVANVAAFSAIADVVSTLGEATGSRASLVAAPQREPSFSEKALAWAGLIVPGVTSWAGIHENAKTQRHLSDNQSATDISNNNMWATIVGGQSTALSAAAGKPNLVVGGNYGNTTTNTAGTNLVSGAGNTIGTNNGNSGRISSDGPFDDHSGDCRDSASCPPVVPDPTL